MPPRLIASVFLLATLVTDFRAAPAESTRPNVVFILCDDLGYGDVSALNPQGKIRTPQMDRLAREGMVFTDSFYWDQTPVARTWAQRYMQRMPTPPGLQHAAMYTGVTHWLKAVKAVGSFDADAVAAHMKAERVNDFYNSNVELRQDGRCMHVMNLWQVKPESEAKGRFDFCKLITHIPPNEAWRPLSEGGCPLVRA